MSEKKTLAQWEVKDADQGLVQAVFSSFNVVDSDGDVTDPGAFDDGAAVRISAYGHASWAAALPVGKGVIRTTDDAAILDGQFFLSTQQGRDTFLTVKEMGDLQEWSYGFDIVKSSESEMDDQKVRVLERLKVHEVSPVMLGAGVDTRTLAVKCQTLADDSEGALAHVLAVVERSRSLADLQAKEGRTLSAANRTRLSSLAGSLAEAAAAVTALLEETDVEKAARDADLFIRRMARNEHLRAVLTGGT